MNFDILLSCRMSERDRERALPPAVRLHRWIVVPVHVQSGLRRGHEGTHLVPTQPPMEPRSVATLLG